MRGTRARRAPVLLAEALAGSWRASPPEPKLACGELARVAPLLVGSGAAALAWWKVRGSSLEVCAAAETLKESYRRQALQSALQEREVEHVFALLRSAGVEPILLKGRAAAGLYPERGLRPPGDIDLCVRLENLEAAQAALRDRERGGTSVVDLTHDPVYLLGGGSWDGLYARSRLVTLNDSRVRVLGHEDQLRFLCIHLLKHGAYRPLWLCDVAAAVESAPPDFDWEVALGGGALQRNWVNCVIDLAIGLLGARREDLPAEAKSARAPAWLAAEVLRQWERPTTAEHLPRELMSRSLRHPARALPALLSRWPDPVRALVGLNQPFDERARLPRQLKFYAARSAAFLRRPLRRSNKL